MTNLVPSFKLYTTNGSTLVYTFPLVQYTNAPQSIKKNTIIESIRGVGGIIIPGSDAMWDLILRFILVDENYENITTKITALESAVVLHTAYVLKFNKSINTYYSYNVKRIDPIEYSDSMRVYDQEVTIKFKSNAW
jgi:hypothetical protein